jgi:hypothetical protein
MFPGNQASDQDWLLNLPKTADQGSWFPFFFPGRNGAWRADVDEDGENETTSASGAGGFLAKDRLMSLDIA